MSLSPSPSSSHHHCKTIIFIPSSYHPSHSSSLSCIRLLPPTITSCANNPPPPFRTNHHEKKLSTAPASLSISLTVLVIATLQYAMLPTRLQNSSLNMIERYATTTTTTTTTTTVTSYKLPLYLSYYPSCFSCSSLMHLVCVIR